MFRVIIVAAYYCHEDYTYDVIDIFLIRHITITLY